MINSSFGTVRKFELDPYLCIKKQLQSPIEISAHHLGNIRIINFAPN